MVSERIGILGSGDVGKALGRGFARHDWDVKVGTRSPAKLADWKRETTGTVSVGSFATAVEHGDVVALALRGDAAESVVADVGPDAFGESLVLDATNPLTFEGPDAPALSFGGTDSLGERLQAALPEASLVKCFNTVSNVQMVDPSFEGETPPMLICGDDEKAKSRTEEILRELGWPGAMDAGPVSSARYLEALVPLWVRVGEELGTWRHAFMAVE